MSALPQFNGTIGPANLLGLVRNTAPFLFAGNSPPVPSLPPQNAGDRPRLLAMGAHPLGWLAILHHAQHLPAIGNPDSEEREDYFALCLACHHATVATFIPTDVDSKIRGHLWQQREDPQALRRMFDFCVHAMSWDISRISRRATERSGAGPVSGHNGEMLGVLAGALGAFIKNGDADYAVKAAQAIDTELEREVHEFRHVLNAITKRPLTLPSPPSKGGEGTTPELDLLRLAASLTHNVGDLDQGISFWPERAEHRPYRARFQRLAHENAQPYGGAFQIAARLYKAVMASEGHRNYPLREVRALRSSPDFLLPLGPFLDEWGFRVGCHERLTTDDRAEVLAALLSGCRKISGQVGYYRAISGMARALDGRLDEVARLMPASLRQEMKNPDVRRHIALKQVSFESALRKRARAVLG